VQEGDIAYLRARDQLNIERGKGTVFVGFHEGLIDFLPTYKFQPGTDEYEQRPEKKLRAPAWCDR
jgi:phosphatidylinositol-bisphosphatase